MLRTAHLRAGFRVLKRHLRYAGGNPRKLLWVARRAVDLARQGSLAGVLERHVVQEAHYADYTQWLARYEPAADAGHAGRVAALAATPLISVLMPVFDPPVAFLEAAIASVRAQCYPAWELVIADDASTREDVRACLARAAAADARVRVLTRGANGGIARATNDALHAARGSWCAFLDHDDVLAPDALLCVAEAGARDPSLAFVFSDEDKLDADGLRTRPWFKPAFDGEWLRTTNCVLHFMAVQTALLRELGGLATGIDGAQDWDLVLRVEERVGRARIERLPFMLYHWREIPGSTAASVFEKPALVAAQRKVIVDTLARRGEGGEPVHTTHGWRIAYSLPTPPPLVSLVIPTRDRVELLRACIESVRAHTDYPALEFVVVDNDSRDPAAVAYLAELARTRAARVVAYPHAFNYAAQCNLGAREARGGVIALVNNDIEATDGGWLRELVSLAARPGIGLVGATLRYPDATLQHAGVILGLNGVGDRPWIGTPPGYAGPYGRALATREMAAMITACAVVMRERYWAAGGMDEALPVSCNDLDFCLRLARAGLRNLVTPHAVLVHHESASRGLADDPENARRSAEEEAQFAARWPQALADDPWYNPNLALAGSAYALAWPPRVRRPLSTGLPGAAL